MANKIKLKRGQFANLPTLDEGEPAFTTDTHDLYIGSSNHGNYRVSSKSNPNLLANPFFTLNTRGLSSGTIGTTSTVVIDRWTVVRCNYSITSAGFQIAWDGTNSTNASIAQRTGIKSDSGIVGKYVTFSAIIDGALRSVTGPALSTTTATTETFGDVQVQFFYNATYGYICQIQNNSTTSITIRAAKFELGTSSTLLEDIAPTYGPDLINSITGGDSTNDPKANNPIFWSAPNLLDNPWFTINQRNSTSGNFDNKVYRMDRWFTTWGTSASGTWTLADGVLTMNAPSNSVVYFAQHLNNGSLNGKILTASVLTGDDTIYSSTICRNSSLEQSFNLDAWNGGNIKIGNTGILYISCGAGKTITIKAVKLEIGPVSTLCNDAVPNYADELAKCQYYYEKITATSGNLSMSMGNVGSTVTTVYVPFKIAPKRIKPTIGSSTLKLGTSSLSISASAVTWLSFDPNTGYGTLQLTIPSGQTAGTVLRFGMDQNSYMTFNADF